MSQRSSVAVPSLVVHLLSLRNAACARDEEDWRLAKHVVIRVDASERIGGGHAMRCLTLADALAGAGAEVTFVCAAMPEALAGRIAGAGHRLEWIERSPEMDRDGARWEEPPLSKQGQLADAEATRTVVGRTDWAIVDHYLFDARWHSAARSFADRLLVIDDLANRSYDCDILLDQTFGKSQADYRDRVSDSAKVLTGATYALLRPEFPLERPAALERRKSDGPVRRILISMGTADPGGVTGRIAEQVLAAAPEFMIDVVLGPQAASLQDVRELAQSNLRITVHSNSERMAELMRDADLAVGAAGMTSWERCCLGLSAVVLVLADNQRRGAEALQSAGAAVAVDHVGKVGPKVAELLADTRLLARMSAAAFAVVDGLGTSRVVGAMLGGPAREEVRIELRRARKTDSELLWLWRNDPLMRLMAKTHDPITWRDHDRWFGTMFDSDRAILYIAVVSGEPAAMVRFDLNTGRALVSINVAPHARGRGIGTAALASACDAFEAAHPDSMLWAEVRDSNKASKLIFGAAGFQEIRSETSGFAEFVRRAADRPGTAEDALS